MLLQTCRGDDFRKDYSHLGMVCAAFPTAPVLAPVLVLVHIIDRKHIKESLCLKKCVEIVANPDRRNIFYEKYFREGQDVDAIERICMPIANDLLKNTINYPLTIVYLSLKWCGYVYKLFENVISTWLSC